MLILLFWTRLVMLPSLNSLWTPFAKTLSVLKSDLLASLVTKRPSWSVLMDLKSMKSPPSKPFDVKTLNSVIPVGIPRLLQDLNSLTQEKS